MPEDERILVEEIARAADRLERLDAHLTDGRVWFSLRRLDEDGSIVTVRIDNALGEARQLLTAVKGAIGELRALRTGKGAPRRTAGGQQRQSGVGKTIETKTEVPAGVGDLAARLAARRTSTAG